MTLAERLVWETEGYRGAAERGWLGEEAREEELERQRLEHEAYLAAQEAETGGTAEGSGNG